MLNEEEIVKYSSSSKWIMLILATVVQASATLITYGVGVLAIFWKQKYILTTMQVGLLISVVNIGPLFCMLFVGRLLDRYSERVLIGSSSVLLGISLLFVNVVGGFVGLLFILLLVGVFYSTSQPGGSKIILKWFPKENRGLAMGIRQAGIPIGGAIAGFIIPLLSYKFSLSCTIYVLSSVCILGGIVFLMFYKEPYAHRGSSQQNKKTSFGVQLKQVICTKSLYPVFITGICMISLQMVLVGHFLKFLVVVKSITPILAGEIFSITLFSGMIGRIILAVISDVVYKGNRRMPLLISVCISCLLIVVLIITIHNIAIGGLFLLSSLLGFFAIGWFSLFMTEITEKANEEVVGLTVSFALTLNQVAIMIAPTFFGYIVDGKGYMYAWGGFVVLLFISSVSLYVSNKR
ncbi:MFS transporter [Bacillus clarus]|uniref:MFS transporter n=1 Tax=Bacillus clarus TaxID=2338372 RepID=A0A090YWE1_9BACI|nr:MFS transporter [Bacillus clarus]KFN02348.1 major Facilitator Superfamily protein [Bacillus clarus]RFT62347.1 MFS transporter [Bacillus clarus]